MPSLQAGSCRRIGTLPTERDGVLTIEELATYSKIYGLAREGKIDDRDLWITEYNEQRPHRGKYCFGKNPMQTFRDSIPLPNDKMLDRTLQTVA